MPRFVHSNLDQNSMLIIMGLVLEAVVVKIIFLIIQLLPVVEVEVVLVLVMMLGLIQIKSMEVMAVMVL